MVSLTPKTVSPTPKTFSPTPKMVSLTPKTVSAHAKSHFSHTETTFSSCKPFFMADKPILYGNIQTEPINKERIEIEIAKCKKTNCRKTLRFDTRSQFRQRRDAGLPGTASFI